MANNGILKFFGDVGTTAGKVAGGVLQAAAKPFTLPFEDAQATVDAKRQQIEQRRLQDQVGRFNLVHEKAQEFGDPATPEYQQAFTAYAEVAGFTPQQTKGFLALQTSGRLQQWRDLARAAPLAKANTGYYGLPSSEPLQRGIESLIAGIPARQTGGAPEPRMGMPSMENRSGGGLTLSAMDPNQAQGGVVPQGEVVPRRTPVDLVAGMGPVNPAWGRPAYSSKEAAAMELTGANLLSPGQVRPPAAQTPAPVAMPPAQVPTIQRVSESLFRAGGGQVPAKAPQPLDDAKLRAQAATDLQDYEKSVKASNPPQTLEQTGVQDADAAEQLQFIQATINDQKRRRSKLFAEGGLPQDFDVRQDYQRRPDFYAQLFKYIKNGIPDPANPNQRRRLTMDEILTAINRGH